MAYQSNILDPVHSGLDDRVFDNATDLEPRLKPRHRHWITRTVHDALEKAGYEDIDSWLSLVLTGSLTTYQYSDVSDVDVSLFVNADHFPDWSRAEMIGVMVGNVDGKTLPGTPHPMQCFVVPPDVSREDLYQPGLRSGYDLDADTWIVPPDRTRTHDVAREQQADYIFALECADKMEKLLKYEPDRAIQYWHQIHHRRQRDQKAGKGDFAQSNIVYKELANRGLFPEIAQASGEYIASRTAAMDPPYQLNSQAVDKAATHLGLRYPVNVTLVGGAHGRYRGLVNGKHQIDAVWWLNPERANFQIWHELAHAVQAENGMEFKPRPEAYDEYRSEPHEVEADQIATSAPFSVVTPLTKTAAWPLVRKFVYDGDTDELKLGDLGPEEGSVLSHNQLAKAIGLDFLVDDYQLGTISQSGWVQFEGGRGGAKVRAAAELALKKALSNEIEGFIGGESNLILNQFGNPDSQWDFAQTQPEPAS